MRIPALLLATALAIPSLAPSLARAQETKEIGHVNTALTNLGLTRSHRVVIERFDDPEVKGVSCYISQARTGGVSGMVGLAEDPARFGLSCSVTGPVVVDAKANRGDETHAKEPTEAEHNAKHGAIKSDDDGFVPSTASRRLAEARPDLVTLVPFSVAKHVRLWNYDPTKYTAAIRSWLAATAPAAG